MAKYTIAGIPFGTKREIQRHVRGILDRTPIGSVLQGQDRQFMLALLRRHPRYDQKAGAGIRDIAVQTNTHWKPCKMFVLLRIDGSSTDFSYRTCIYSPSKKQEFVAACREAVVNDILLFKERYFARHANADNEIWCPLAARWIGWEEAHVDHQQPWPFRRIVDAYLQHCGIRPDDVALAGHEDGECQIRFSHNTRREDFRAFHNRRACLRVISQEAHVQTTRCS